MLQKYTYRKVGLLGALLFFSGSFITIFAKNLFHMVIGYGILQGRYRLYLRKLTHVQKFTLEALMLNSNFNAHIKEKIQINCFS